MGKNSFVFHGDWLDVIQKFPDEIQLEIYRAMACYGLQREMPKMSPTAKIIMTVIATKLDEDNEKYKAICEKNRKNAKSKRTKKRGDRQRVTEEKTMAATANDGSEPQRPLTMAATANDGSELSQPSIDIDNDIDIDMNKKKNNKKRSGRFVPPTIEDVKAYIAEKGYNVDAELWWNFYASKGWMIGKNKMVSWKNTIVTWVRNSKREEYGQGKSTGAERQYKAGETAYNRVLSRIDARQSGKSEIDTDDLFRQQPNGNVQE